MKRFLRGVQDSGLQSGEQSRPLPRVAPGPPPKYKTFVIIWIAVYFVVIPTISLLRPWVSGLPPALGSAISAAIVVALMTWVVLPILNRLFRFWLFKPDRVDES